MIPDKIYIPIIEEDGKKLLCTNWWETDTSSRNAYVKETIPYIRKDALLEWAKQMMEHRENLNDTYYESGITVLEMLTDKLNSM